VLTIGRKRSLERQGFETGVEMKAGGEAEASRTGETADADGSGVTGEEGGPDPPSGVRRRRRRVVGKCSVPELISDLLWKILPSAFSSQKTFLFFQTHPPRLQLGLFLNFLNLAFLLRFYKSLI